MARGKKTGGRKAGVPNKATAEVKSLASQHGKEVIEELARLALNAKSEQARVLACRELLDRAYGRPTQTIDTPPGGTMATLMSGLQHIAARRATRLPAVPPVAQSGLHENGNGHV